VQTHSSHLPGSDVHFEFFSVPDEPAGTPVAGSFMVELRKSGQSLTIPADKSVLDVLEAHGHKIPFSCREGLCRTCETTVCSGEPEHRDYVLSQEERNANCSMMVCVSRAVSPVLVLDL
jgi:vanillate O-demethylase ferredoxin subunit